MEPVLRRPLTCISPPCPCLCLFLCLTTPCGRLTNVCHALCAAQRMLNGEDKCDSWIPLPPLPLSLSLPLSFLLLLLLLLRWIEFDLIMHKHIWNYCYCYCNVYVYVVCVSVLYMCSLINCRGQDLRRCWPFTRLEFQTENCKHFNIKCTKQQQQQQQRNNSATTKLDETKQRSELSRIATRRIQWKRQRIMCFLSCCSNAVMYSY